MSKQQPGSAPVAAGVCYMTRDEVREHVAKNAAESGDKRAVEIYDYESRKLAEPVPMATVSRVVQDARRVFAELRAAHPGEPDKALRKRMMDADPRFKSMGDRQTGTHTVMFKKLTCRDTPPEHLRVILEMMQMRARQESGATDPAAATQEVTAFFSSRVKAVQEATPAAAPRAEEGNSDEEEEGGQQACQ
jgi:hypothetical protein